MAQAPRSRGASPPIQVMIFYAPAPAFRSVSVKKLARLVYDGSHQVGEELARALMEAATRSVGAHHGKPCRLQVRYSCEDIDLPRRRLRALESDIEQRLAQHLDAARLKH